MLNFQSMKCFKTTVTLNFDDFIESLGSPFNVYDLTPKGWAHHDAFAFVIRKFEKFQVCIPPPGFFIPVKNSGALFGFDH